MTTAPARVPQVRLPGQAAAPDGPVDLIRMYLVHHAFRRDLAAFADAVPRTPVEAVSAWRALADRWVELAKWLHHHHRGEDAGVWPALRARCDAAGDAEGRATLESMEAEHAGIDPLLESCSAGMGVMGTGGSADDRAALAVRMAALRDALDRHLAHEEAEAMALVQRYMTDAEWQDLEVRSFGRPAPRDVPFLIPWLTVGVPGDVLDRAFRGGQGRVLQVAWWMTRGRFIRRHRQAFGGG